MAVLGVGLVGKVIAYDLFERVTGSDLVLVDSKREALDEAKKYLNNKVELMQADLSSEDSIYRIVKNVDAAVSALPGRLGKLAWLAAIRAGIDLVDVSYSPDDPLSLHVQAREAGITIVPDAGVAPGLSNLMAGRAYASLDEVYSLKIYAGGIPENPIPPLGYLVTWSPEDLIEEYIRPVRVIKDGKLVIKEPVSEVEKVLVPEVGELEAFLTDGLRSMLKTLKDVKEMEEKTLRWPGHAEKINLLKTLGYLDMDPVEANGGRVVPALVTANLFRRKLKGGSKDMTVLLVKADGRRGLDRVEIEYRLVDRYDDRNGFYSVSRTTAFAATAFLKLVSEGSVPGPGVVPPEVIGMDDSLFASIAEWISWRGIKIIERVTEAREVPSTP